MEKEFVVETRPTGMFISVSGFPHSTVSDAFHMVWHLQLSLCIAFHVAVFWFYSVAVYRVVQVQLTVDVFLYDYVAC